jgi:hypothetical protein
MIPPGVRTETVSEDMEEDLFYGFLLYSALFIISLIATINSRFANKTTMNYALLTL